MTRRMIGPTYRRSLRVPKLSAVIRASAFVFRGCIAAEQGQEWDKPPHSPSLPWRNVYQTRAQALASIHEMITFGRSLQGI
jgi:hypothetical protein